MNQRKRQLAAIVFTDIVGYSALMRQDERLAVEIRRRHRAVFDTLTPQYGGKILQYYGDGTLSIFDSTVAAVECAIAMQRAFRLAPEVPLRIGIHSGDITYDSTDVYGDGVNVASRIEPCCVAGGILVTGKVFDDIKNHDWISARDLGTFIFKGIEEPIRLYAVDNEGIAVPAEAHIQRLRHAENKLVAIHPAVPQFVPERVRQIALVAIPVLLLGLLLLNIFPSSSPRQAALIGPPAPPTPPGLLQQEEKSIAVLPFSNLSEQAGNDYFSDGITEDILTLLSHIDGLKVVSRTSVMQYKNTEKDIRQIGRELNADHILEGSVRREGNKVRIAAQLIDARNDDHIWANTYDHEITEIFEVQSEVAQEIARALKHKLSDHERREIFKKPTGSMEAYELYLKGREMYARYTMKDNEKAIELFNLALRADPSFAHAYAGLGDALAQKAFQRDMDAALLDSAIAVSTQAIRLDKDLSDGYKARGLAYHYRGWHEQALREYEEAVRHNSNNEMAINNIGMIHLELGNVVEAIRWSRRALLINPRNPVTMLNLANLYNFIGDDKATLEVLTEGLQKHPDYTPFRELIAAVYLGQQNWAAAKDQALQLIAGKMEHPAGFQLMGEISLAQGNLEDAGAFFREASFLAKKVETGYEDYYNEIGLAYVEIKSGNAALGQTRLRALLPSLEATATHTDNRKGAQFALGMAYAVLGDDTQSVHWLQHAADNLHIDSRLLRIHPIFQDLRRSPAFQVLLRQLDQRMQHLRREVAALNGKETMI